MKIILFICTIFFIIANIGCAVLNFYTAFKLYPDIAFINLLVGILNLGVAIFLITLTRRMLKAVREWKSIYNIAIKIGKIFDIDPYEQADGEIFPPEDSWKIKKRCRN